MLAPPTNYHTVECNTIRIHTFSLVRPTLQHLLIKVPQPFSRPIRVLSWLEHSKSTDAIGVKGIELRRRLFEAV